MFLADEISVGQLTSAWSSFWRDERAQDLVEYSLLLAFIALAAVGLLSSVKTSIRTLWTDISTTLQNAATASS